MEVGGKTGGARYLAARKQVLAGHGDFRFASYSNRNIVKDLKQVADPKTF